MGRKHLNRRGKKSRNANKNGFRSHDPELNGGKGPVYVGRNAAPAKSDGSVLNTTLLVKEPRVFQPVVEDEVAPVISTKKLKADRHAELKRIGEEKRRLLASMTGASNLPAPVRDLEKENRRKETKRKYQEAARQDPVIKTSMLPSTPDNSKHSEHKRQKMRERERQKRARTIEKKVVKRLDSNEKRIANKPAFGEVMERPSEAIKDLGAKLAQKLHKGQATFTSAYDKIKKIRS